MSDGPNAPEIYQEVESPEIKALKAEPIHSTALRTILEMKQMPELREKEAFKRWADADDAIILSDSKHVSRSAQPLLDELKSLPPQALIHEYARGMIDLPAEVFPSLFEGLDKVITLNGTDERDLSPEVSQELVLLLDVVNSRLSQASTGSDPEAEEMRQYSTDFGSTITDWAGIEENAFQEGKPLRAAAKKVVTGILKNINPGNRNYNDTKMFQFGVEQQFPDLIQPANPTTPSTPTSQ